MDEKHLGDQFPFIGGRAMGIEDQEKTTLRYKLWISLIRLSELTSEETIDDGSDFAFNVENEIKKLERELCEK
jgi:hypothetical protein